MEATYITSAQNAKALKLFDAPEVAFVGRSNSGKSSLLNALLVRKSLARSGRTPGLTKMVNFFKVVYSVKPDDEPIIKSEKEKERKVKKTLIFADLPGIGYAESPGQSKLLWDELMVAYFKRPRVRAVLFLLDARRKIDPDDEGFLRFLSKNCDLIVVLTKTDKLNVRDLKKKEQEAKELCALKKISVVKICSISNIKKTGIEELRTEVLRYGE